MPGLVAFLGAAGVQAKQHAQPRAGVFDVLRHIERGELWLLARTIFQRLPVEREAFVFFAFAAPYFFVEAALRFIAKPFAVQHLSVKIGK